MAVPGIGITGNGYEVVESGFDNKYLDKAGTFICYSWEFFHSSKLSRFSLNIL